MSLCCLCLGTADACFCVQGDQELTAKIARVFYFEVAISSEHPACICQSCKHIIEEFYSYAERVAKNRELLRTEEHLETWEDQDDFGEPIEWIEHHLEGGKPGSNDEGEDKDECVDQVFVALPEGEVQNKREVTGSEDESMQLSKLSDDLPKHSSSPASNIVCQSVRQKDEHFIQGQKPTLEQILLRYKLSCDLCSMPLSDFVSLQKHFKRVHNIPGYLQCCNKKIYKKNLMIEHLQVHINPDTFRCDLCSKSYSCSKVLHEHKKEVHTPEAERSFRCATCGKAFVSKSHLNTHTQVSHGSEPCPQCEKILSSKSAVRKHLLTMHGEGKTFVCERCARMFRSKQSFEAHLKNHQGRRKEGKVQCTICSAWLMDKYILQKHMRHMHTQDAGGVQCTKCDKLFRNQTVLKCHLLRSHVERRFECRLCCKRFKRAHHMREHIAIHHTGELLYGCSHCSERFTTSNKQLAHRKTMHPDEFKQELRKRKLIE